jgi:hypothetical protein
VAGNSTLTNATAAHNWTYKQCVAHGRGNSVSAYITLKPYLPYYQGWALGGDGDEDGIAGVDDTHGMPDWTYADAANSYDYDTYTHTNNGDNPQLLSTGAQADGTALPIYTGTSALDLQRMYETVAGAGLHIPLKTFMTQSAPGPWSTSGGTTMGFLDYLPNAIWLAFTPYSTSTIFTTAASGWSTNGGFLSKTVVENVTALADPGSGGDYAAYTQTGANHMCEADVHISMFKRGSK